MIVLFPAGHLGDARLYRDLQTDQLLYFLHCGLPELEMPVLLTCNRYTSKVRFIRLFFFIANANIECSLVLMMKMMIIPSIWYELKCHTNISFIITIITIIIIIVTTNMYSIIIIIIIIIIIFIFNSRHIFHPWLIRRRDKLQSDSGVNFFEKVTTIYLYEPN